MAPRTGSTSKLSTRQSFSPRWSSLAAKRDAETVGPFIGRESDMPERYLKAFHNVLEHELGWVQKRRRVVSNEPAPPAPWEDPDLSEVEQVRRRALEMGL